MYCSKCSLRNPIQSLIFWNAIFNDIQILCLGFLCYQQRNKRISVYENRASERRPWIIARVKLLIFNSIWLSANHSAQIACQKQKSRYRTKIYKRLFFFPLRPILLKSCLSLIFFELVSTEKWFNWYFSASKEGFVSHLLIDCFRTFEIAVNAPFIMA